MRLNQKENTKYFQIDTINIDNHKKKNNNNLLYNIL